LIQAAKISTVGCGFVVTILFGLTVVHMMGGRGDMCPIIQVFCHPTSISKLDGRIVSAITHIREGISASMIGRRVQLKNRRVGIRAAEGVGIVVPDNYGILYGRNLARVKDTGLNTGTAVDTIQRDSTSEGIRNSIAGGDGSTERK